jgi:DNA-binding transcriptional ArsR family regulator
LEAAAAQFRALAEPARLKVLRRLMAGEASVGRLAEELGSSQANASKHVAVLAAAGFVRRRKDGSTVVCSLGDEVVRELCALMCERAVTRAAEGLRVVGG